MTIPNTYDNLTLAIQEELEDTSSEFVTYIPTAIFNAEQRINRDVDGLFNKYVTTVAVTGYNREVSKPTGHKLTYTVNVLSNNTLTPLKKKSECFIDDYWPNITSVGTPEFYADKDKTTIIVAPTPSSSTSFVFSYAKTNTVLSSGNQTNPIIDFYPDLLFKASLVEQAKCFRMTDAQALYEQDYQTLLAAISEETRRERTDNTAPRDRANIDENRKNKGA